MAMMQEESRMKLHSEAKRDVGMRSTLIVSNSGMTGAGRDSKMLQLQRSGSLKQILS
jgi:hypothetical protein